MTSTLPPSATDAAFIALPPGGIRRLRPNDARQLSGLPAWIWGIWKTPEAMLRAVPAYARYLRGELISISCVFGETERFAVIAAYTIERTRRNGFARECAQRLIGAVVNERGKQPVLTTRRDNEAAVGLAHALGLTQAVEATGYIIQ
jgi:ribosomal protein S18 acetylase RimI-like enzyme